ncbi:MAG TPA: ABC transporter ATP-binding protein [Candidatus Dormibacteraeota bacterium]|nr:ABC transporter ATP-binding protein [Candidatus Dormibacteraeota bacterium]
MTEPPHASGTVTLTGLVKRYGTTRALDGVSLTVAPGEFFTLLGPSGCGKTTTLRSVAGFVAPDAGEVAINRVVVTGVPPHRRHVGMVFQHYALFPHRTVAQNVGFGLRMQRVAKPEIDRLVGDALALVQLPGHGKRYPGQLSGGEQQRVALARALVTRPAVLLLDEPLGALDKKLRDHMKIELKRLQREVGITTIYVTHDQEEALTMSDRIAVMHRGRVEQVATPRGLYETPATAFVAGFIGNINLLSGRGAGANTVECGSARLAVSGATPAGAAVAVALRPERVRLDPTGAVDTVLAMTVAHVVYQGETVRYILQSDAGFELQALELGEVRFTAGARVRAGWAAADARILQEEPR